MNTNQALWEKGDFTRLAATMRESGEALVQRLGVRAGMRVLDLGCGDGPTAPLEAAGLANLRIQEGDASDLAGIADASFDLVVSIFGAMFAPRPHDVAKEMVRVTKLGGRIVMGNWIPGDAMLVAQLLRISAAYAPPPPEGFVSPMSWGVEANVLERFGGAGIPAERITWERDTYVFRFDGPPAELAGLFRDCYGPTMNAFEAAEKAGRAAELQAELEGLFTGQNTSDDPGRTTIPATFLRVTVVR